MRIVRTFHPIGQGAFYSERFYEGTQQNVIHNVVFDCGVSVGHERRVKHVVTQAFTDTDEIEFLFISHLDYDHVSLVETLFTTVKSVKNLVLPLLYQEQLIIAMTYYRLFLYKLPWMGYMIDFLQKIINHLNGVGDDDFNNGEYNIYFVGNSEENSENIGRARLWESGTPKQSGWNPEWIYIPYNIEYRSRKLELISELGNLLTDAKFTDEIKKIGEGPFKDGGELYERLKDTAFVETVLSNRVLRASIRRAYEKVKGGTNENSIVLYSGPASYKYGYVVENCMPCRLCTCCDYYCAGCLYTGDSTFDLKKWRDAIFTSVWDCIGSIQIPHHGSVDSFDVTTDPIDRPYIMPASFGNYNTYGHPSGKVLAYLLTKDCCVQMVTEDAGTLYMQRIEK